MMAVIAAGHVEQLRAQADRDSLTGMLNRRAFMRELGTEIERSLRYGRRFVLALCDLDDFKQINDTDGHPAGDRALEAVAALLQAHDPRQRLRLPHRRRRVRAAAARDRRGRGHARRSSGSSPRWPATACSRHGLGISFGLALFPADGKTPEELIRRADQALYAAKRSDDDVQLRAARRLSGHTLGGVADPGHVAVGTWSGGRFMRFGEAIDDERLAALLRPGDGIDTVLTADAYGAGEADELLGRALRGVDARRLLPGRRRGPRLLRRRARGRPRASRASPIRACAGPTATPTTCGWRPSARCERLGADRFDLLLLHNPDRIGYTSPAVWEGMAALRDAGLTRLLGVAPGPANGFTLDVIDCLERFGELIDWAMVILNPLEPWPGELVLPAAQRYGIDVITRVVDYGGLFWDDVRPGHAFAQHDHRAFRPDGWVQAGRERLERMRPIAERHGLTALQLACQWNLAHDPRALRGPHAHRGARRREADRGQARRARRRPARARPLRRRARRDPRDRRQHRLHGAQGRLAAVRGRAAARPLAADRASCASWPRAGRSSPSASCRT